MGLFLPAIDPTGEEAWEHWARLEDAIKGEDRANWATVAPHLAPIEAALAADSDRRAESWTIRHPGAMATAKRAARGLADGAAKADDPEEALRRLDFAARTAVQIARSPTMISALVGVSTFRDVLKAAGALVERRMYPERNARLREIVDPLLHTPWREVVLGELRFALGFLDDLGTDPVASGNTGDDRWSRTNRRIARRLERPGEVDRAKLIVAHRLARGLAPEAASVSESDDLLRFDRVAPTLEAAFWEHLSPDPLRRDMAKSMSIWPQLPQLYRSVAGHRRMVRLASFAADLPPGSGFAAVERLRAELGPEGWDPFLRNPLRVLDEGDAWRFLADAGPEIAAVRIVAP